MKVGQSCVQGYLLVPKPSQNVPLVQQVAVFNLISYESCYSLRAYILLLCIPLLTRIPHRSTSIAIATLLTLTRALLPSAGAFVRVLGLLDKDRPPVEGQGAGRFCDMSS